MTLELYTKKGSRSLSCYRPRKVSSKKEAMIAFILLARKQGFTFEKIGKYFNVSRQYIYQIYKLIPHLKSDGRLK